MPNDSCGVKECGRTPTRARGLCDAHLNRFYRHGDTFPEIPIRSRGVCPAGHDIEKVGKVNSQCRLCHQAGTRTWRRRKKSALVTIKGGKCQDCGFNFLIPERLECADFDHIAERTLPHGFDIMRLPLAALEKEIEICELVCANCHRTRSRNRGRNNG